MKAFILLSVVAAASAAQIVAPYAGLAGLPYAGYAGYAGYPYAAGLPYAGLAGYPYAAGFAAPVVAAPAKVEAVEVPAPTVVAAPVSTSRVIAAPGIPLANQFQSQDEFGNLAFGYANPHSAKQEVGNTYGGVTGSYSYTDANGLVQTVNYIADGLGFRVAATNLPVAPAVPEVEPLVAPTFNPEPLVAPVFNPEPLVAPVYSGVAPEHVAETPEVLAARAEFQKIFDEVNAREKRSTPAATTALEVAPLPAALPYAGYAGFPYAAGLPYAAGYAGLPYAGHGYAGLGYAGLGYAGLGYAGLGHAGLGYAGLGLAAPAVAAPLAAPAGVVASAPLAARDAVKTIIKNNPGFAESYIVN